MENVACANCGHSDRLLFPQRKDNRELFHICVICIKLYIDHYNYHQQDDENAYVLKWKLCDDTGKEWVEEHKEMSMSDFEVVYGNNVHKIVWCVLRMKNRAVI